MRVIVENKVVLFYETWCSMENYGELLQFFIWKYYGKLWKVVTAFNTIN